MKILAFVDLHGWFDVLKQVKEKAINEDVDLILCGGDFTVFGKDIKLILKRMNDIGKPVLLVHGNHEDRAEIEKYLPQFDNLVFIDRGAYIIDNYMFFGYGGGGFAQKDSSFVNVSEKVYSDFKKSKLDKFVLLLHGPPYGNELDMVYEDHVGNKDYTDFIKKAQPCLVICGHLHENSEIEDKLGKSLIVNPGPYGMIYDI
jgi:Icc-related predicted phosphoesterase